MPLTDEEILACLNARDQTALEELQRQYGRYCAAIAGGILADGADVEEVCADVWMQVWSSIPPNQPEHLRLYVGRLARNAALNRLEYRSAQKRSGPLEELTALTPDRSLEHQALRDALEQFLRGLNPEYRQMFLRRYWYGDGVEEIARRFGCTRVRVSGILLRLRRKLKDLLEQEELFYG